MSVSSFNFKSQFLVSILSFNFEFQFKVSVSSFSFKFPRQNSVSSFNLNQIHVQISILIRFKFLFKSKVLGFGEAPVGVVYREN